MKFFRQAVLLNAVVIILFASCKKENTKEPEVDLALVHMNDFQLEETAYKTIAVTHPVVTDGIETQPGEIEVVIPKGATQLQLTPKKANFTQEGFTISPDLNRQQNFLNRVVIYRIASTKDPSKGVHYYVRIREEVVVDAGNVAITGFSFRKSKNPGLPEDIQSARILQGMGTIGKVFVFVPQGTDFTGLTPSFTHNGTGLFYSQDPASTPATTTTVYPDEGTAIDFAYPKVFYAVVKKGAESRTYQVIVDLQQPMLLSNTAVTTANVKAGKSQLVAAATFRNQGNHPISIVGITQSQQEPAGLNVVRGVASVPAFGLLPGADGNVMASVSAQTYPPGTYKVKTTFRPRLVGHPEADDLLQPAALQITTTIEN